MTEGQKLEILRVLVCGGRDYSGTATVYAVLDDLLRTNAGLVVIEGGARGADRIARDWTTNHNEGSVEHWSFPADWDKYGKRAGYIRNKEMLDVGKPDLVLAFPGGRGTADMIRQSRKAGVQVTEYVVD